MDLIVWYNMSNKHTFVYVSVWRRNQVGQNVDEGVLIAHTALYNKIHLKIQTLRSILQVSKWPGLNQIVQISKTVFYLQMKHTLMTLKPPGPSNIPATPYPNSRGIPIREQRSPSMQERSNRVTISWTKWGSSTSTVMSRGRESV